MCIVWHEEKGKNKTILRSGAIDVLEENIWHGKLWRLLWTHLCVHITNITVYINIYMCLKTSIGYLPAGKNWILDILQDLVTCQVLNMPIAQVHSKLQGLQTRHQCSWEMLQKQQLELESTFGIRRLFKNMNDHLTTCQSRWNYVKIIQ